MLREECWRSRQGMKVADGRCGTTIEAKPVSDQTCLIEPAEDVAYDSGERDMTMAALADTLPRRNNAPAELNAQSLRRDGQIDVSSWRTGSCFRLSTGYLELAIRRLEDLCVSRQNRLSSKSSNLESPRPTTGKHRSGEKWTSHPIRTYNRKEIRLCRRPLRVTTTDLNVSYATALSLACTGCSPAKKLAARWACAAAWKIARLSSDRTFSHEAR